MRLERWALIQSDQSPYQKRSCGFTDTGVARTQENHVRIARTLAVCEPRRALGRNQPADTLTRNFQPPDLSRLPGLWHFVMVTRAD